MSALERDEDNPEDSTEIQAGALGREVSDCPEDESSTDEGTPEEPMDVQEPAFETDATET